MSEWRNQRPLPGTAPTSFVEGLARLRDEVRELTVRVDALQKIVEELLSQRVDELARRRSP